MGLFAKANTILVRKKPLFTEKSIDGPQDNSLKDVLIRFHKKTPSFCGLVTEAAGNSRAEKSGSMLEALSRMVSLIGEAVSLPCRASEKNLVLLPRSVDRALIAHRLATALLVNVPLAFDAESPGDALEKLEALL